MQTLPLPAAAVILLQAHGLKRSTPCTLVSPRFCTTPRASCIVVDVLTAVEATLAGGATCVLRLACGSLWGPNHAGTGSPASSARCTYI
jgi:hypothetical protein